MSHSDATLSTVCFDTIGQIAITVDDLPRAKHFYQNTLGMKFLFDAGLLAFLQCGAIRIMLSTPEKSEPRGGTILYYKVDDIQATYSALKQRGAEFLQEPHLIAKMPDHELWMAFLKDTEGNTVGIMSEVRN
ncbi:VOC family protein [Telmatobacter sp. DSM 110680]|uniref:VOC family protein n=1 Tax=Telmatobacter sp. DSM 110680 TaxID=3036704 RepID=A0AAU7DCT4_9BACT